jgi:energy-coupling factor transport system substrate-specific component
MWKKPKMVALVLLTAVLYVGSLFPFRGFTMFGGYADFGRFGVGIPVAFSFLFGPAAAWGAAIGNILHDVAQNQVDPSSFFGFVGNFVLGYVPYKVWITCTKQKPDLRSLKKVALYVGIVLLACVLCGLVIGWGLYWLGYTPFMPTTAIIALTNALWAVTVGAVVLAVSYHCVAKHNLLYTDLLDKQKAKQNRTTNQKIALAVLVTGIVSCFLVGQFLSVDSLVLLPLVLVTLGATFLAFD